MKILSWLALLAISLNSFAANRSLDGLESVLDEYQYAITVEWDQKDREVMQNITENFRTKVEGIVTSEALILEDIQELAKRRIKDSEQLKAFQQRLDISKSSSNELAKFLMDSSSIMYARGASWSGNATVATFIIAPVLILAVLDIWFHATHECVSSEPVIICSEGEVSHIEHCRNDTRCTQYVKK